MGGDFARRPVIHSASDQRIPLADSPKQSTLTEIASLTNGLPKGPSLLVVDDLQITYRFPGRDFRLAALHGQVVRGVLS